MADGVTVPEYPAIALPFVGTDLFEVTRVAEGLTTKCTFDELKLGIVPAAAGAVTVFADADIVNVFQAGVKKTATIAQLKALFAGTGQFVYSPNAAFMTTFRAVQGVNTASPFTANTQRAYRIRVLGKVKVTPRLNVTVAVAGANFAAGLYSIHATTGLPDVLKYDLGQVSLATTGNKAMTQVTIDPGEYFVVFTNSAAVTLTVAPLTVNAEEVTFGTTAIGRLEATATYVFPIGAMSGYTWTQTVNATNTPVFFRVDA